MVVGKTRRGKSSVANTILGEDKFKVTSGFGRSVLASDWQEVERDGRTIEVSFGLNLFFFSITNRYS